jgi:Spy/CpxP family protein refolding chaperone
MKAIIAITFATLLIVTGAIAQQPQQPQQPMHPHPPGVPGDVNAPQVPHPPPPGDPLAHLMFPPDMILDHARLLNLTEEQKTFMRAEVQKATATFQELQWKLQDQTEALHETMKSTSVNEQQALAQLDKVLDIEREIKRLHIGLAVRLKNRLTPEQQEQLHNMRMDDMRPGGPDGPGRPGGPGGDQVPPPLQ